MRFLMRLQKWSCPIVCLVALAGVEPGLAEDLAEFPQRLTSKQEEEALQQRYASYRKVDPDYRHAGEVALERWMDWKWGLRIHWGLYCMFDGSESWIITKHSNDKQWQQNYYASYQQFNPQGFDADEWMNIMQQAGMKYFSFTAKHHEGFCMWPTKTLQKGFRKGPDGAYEDVIDHYSIAETPFKRDIVAELVKAGRAHELGVSLYYSHIDWHDWDFAWDNRNFWYDPTFTKKSQPERWAAFIQKERDQITELLTWYGPIDTLCLDINWPKEAQEDCNDIARLARKLQPNVMLRNRGIDDYGDYETPEGSIPSDPNNMKRPWQVIYPCGTGFSYKKNDTYKSREWVLESLVDIVAKGGNFQVGFGPDPDGKWPKEMIDRVSYVGDWLKVNGECIYATRPYLRYHEGTDLRFTRSKDKTFVYVISLRWPGETLNTRMVKAKEGSKIRMLGVNGELKWRQDATGLTIELPKELQDEAKRPCRQAHAFKIESQPWETFSSSLPDEPSLPSQSKKTK
jgi:alpha-L-fucosidase